MKKIINTILIASIFLAGICTDAKKVKQNTTEQKQNEPVQIVKPERKVIKVNKKQETKKNKMDKFQFAKIICEMKG